MIIDLFQFKIVAHHLRCSDLIFYFTSNFRRMLMFRKNIIIRLLLFLKNFGKKTLIIDLFQSKIVAHHLRRIGLIFYFTSNFRRMLMFRKNTIIGLSLISFAVVSCSQQKVDEKMAVNCEIKADETLTLDKVYQASLSCSFDEKFDETLKERQLEFLYKKQDFDIQIEDVTSTIVSEGLLISLPDDKQFKADFQMKALQQGKLQIKLKVKDWEYAKTFTITENSIVEVDAGTTTIIENPIVEIDAGPTFSVMRRHNGDVWAWGQNGKSLGHGEKIKYKINSWGDRQRVEPAKPIPAQVKTNHPFKQMTVAQYYVLALQENSNRWFWGKGVHGIFGLGDGNYREANVPELADSGQSWKKLDASYWTSAGIKEDGSLWIWGHTRWGVNGDKRWMRRAKTPVKVFSSESSVWQDVSVGLDFALAVKTDGTLWAWGNSRDRKLAIATTYYAAYYVEGEGLKYTNRPIQIGNETIWKSVAAGYKHSLAIKTDGSLWAWGGNSEGELGIGSQIASTSVPTQVTKKKDWKVVNSYAHHTLAIKTDGSLWAWGHNRYGEVGIGSTTKQFFPVRVGKDNDWVSISAGVSHSLALKKDGSLWAWGWNEYGQVGDGTTTNRHKPVKVLDQ